MFKIFRKNCCGLDVHKTWIYACIGITDANSRTEYFQARFSAFSKGLQELSHWLDKYNCKQVCMESAGKFWIPVFNILEKTCLVTLAHPKYTKPQKGNKTDRKDAKWICDLFMCDMIKPSFIPSADQYRHQRSADAALPFPDRLYFAGRRGQQSAQSAASGGLDVKAFGVFHRLNSPQAETISIVPRRERLNPHAVVALHERLLP